MYRRRTRRARGIWFPTTQDRALATVSVVTGAAGAAIAVTATPLVAVGLDTPPNEVTLAGASGAMLGLTTRPGYLVKRIVGSCFVDSQDAAAGANPRVACFGIIVDRVDPTGTLLNISAWNPFQESSVQKRWIFRRSWLLDGCGAFGAPALGSSNRQYGSLREGTQIDSKMKARVSYEERLFLITAVQNIGAGPLTTRFIPLLRMFAQPFTGDNR